MAADITPQTRASLLLRVIDPADRAAWAEFVDIYGGLIYREVGRRGVAHPDADDVTQTVFVRLLSALPRFRYEPERGRFRDWLGTVVRYEVSRHCRGVGRQMARATDPGVLDSTAAGTLDAEWADAFHTRVLAVALQRSRPRFDAPTWDAFVETWVKDRPPSEVAAEFGRSVEWVYVAKSRALKAVSEHVGRLIDGCPFATETGVNPPDIGAGR